ncbi:hypothetical protein QYF61_024556 [Mycteria americana]|uniref:Reverse transcriptase domain-containing protein n=1 Tax=Mycteria americana TaxID=33587 RepID=A0AAN7S1P3_MYCAM|nr:hypothetical protein QYF61_024556 [Mycteria americana]
MGDSLEEKKCPEDLVDFQGSSPPGSGMVHANVQKIKQMWQEACMDDQEAPDKTHTQKGTVQDIEAGSGKSCLTNLIAFYDEMTGSVDEVRALEVVYLDFSKAFNTVCYKILIEKLMKYGLDKWTVRWIENWLNCWAQKVVISGMKYCWRPVMKGVSPESGTGTTGAVQPGEEKAQGGSCQCVQIPDGEE